MSNFLFVNCTRLCGGLSAYQSVCLSFGSIKAAHEAQVGCVFKIVCLRLSPERGCVYQSAFFGDYLVILCNRTFSSSEWVFPLLFSQREIWLPRMRTGVCLGALMPYLNIHAWFNGIFPNIQRFAILERKMVILKIETLLIIHFVSITSPSMANDQVIEVSYCCPTLISFHYDLIIQWAWQA